MAHRRVVMKLGSGPRRDTIDIACSAGPNREIRWRNPIGGGGISNVGGGGEGNARGRVVGHV